jgi:hypothetical protein
MCNVPERSINSAFNLHCFDLLLLSSGREKGTERDMEDMGINGRTYGGRVVMLRNGTDEEEREQRRF